MIVINGLIKLILMVDFVQVITQIKGVLDFLDAADFADNFGFKVGDFVVEFGLLL